MDIKVFEDLTWIEIDESEESIYIPDHWEPEEIQEYLEYLYFPEDSNIPF